jgi:hypothetical protein
MLPDEASNNLPDEPVELFALADAPHRANDALRAQVVSQTVGVVRSRRRWKRIGLAAALAGCYLAGMGTMSLLHSGGGAQIDRTLADSVGESALALLPNGQIVPLATPSPQPAALTPSEQLARDSADSRQEVNRTPYDRLREAGDRLLGERNDIVAAAKTYRQALEVASAEERNLSVDHDNWLLMAIKNDRSQTSAENMQ